MSVERVAVFSGLFGAVSERLSRTLGAAQFKTINVHASKDLSDYFSRLLQRFSEVASAASDKKVISILVSGYDVEAEKATEGRFFFPIVRRMQVSKDMRNDVNRSPELSNRIVQLYKNDMFTNLSKDFKKPIDDRLLLPIRNIKERRIVDEFLKIYNIEQANLSSRAMKFIAKIKGSNRYRIGNVDFEGCLNNERHPIRRCSNTVYCDAAATMRFGFAVAERFEFDVTSANGLKGKSFHQCNGQCEVLSTNPSHLNMRINDDFGY